MALITCSECGKQVSDKAATCPHCGNPIASLYEKPKEEVKENDYEKYLYLARRAKEENNGPNAIKYYDLALQENPDSWEASFYQIYYTSMECKIIQISSAASALANTLDHVIELIKETVPADEQEKCITEVSVRCVLAATMLQSAAQNHYNKFSTTDNALDEYYTRVVNAGYIYGNLTEALKKHFPEKKEIIANSAKAYMTYIKSNEKCYNMNFKTNKSTELEALIKEHEPGYSKPMFTAPQPASSSGGCYVATAVYGSYDCPEVWTLRRYRDNHLAESWYGRLFIHTYYAVSPTVVKYFGKTEWFKRMWKGRLDRMVARLQKEGYASTPYHDKAW